MQVSITVPRAFSFADDREISIIQDLMKRLNPQLIVVPAATGLHVRGGPTVNWGLVGMADEVLTKQEVRAALKDAGLDLQHNTEIEASRIWTDNELETAEQPSL